MVGREIVSGSRQVVLCGKQAKLQSNADIVEPPIQVSSRALWRTSCTAYSTPSAPEAGSTASSKRKPGQRLGSKPWPRHSDAAAVAASVSNRARSAATALLVVMAGQRYTWRCAEPGPALRAVCTPFTGVAGRVGS